jgi:hypothetical protein
MPEGKTIKFNPARGQKFDSTGNGKIDANFWIPDCGSVVCPTTVFAVQNAGFEAISGAMQ